MNGTEVNDERRRSRLVRHRCRKAARGVNTTGAGVPFVPFSRAPVLGCRRLTATPPWRLRYEWAVDDLNL